MKTRAAMVGAVVHMTVRRAREQKWRDAIKRDRKPITFCHLQVVHLQIELKSCWEWWTFTALNAISSKTSNHASTRHSIGTW